MGKVPAGVLVLVLMIRLTLTGLPETGLTLAPGEKMQVAPAGKPLHAKITVPLKEPKAVT